MGNWIADLLLTEFPDSDVSLLNCGTLRSNQLHPKGEITLKTLSNILPMVDKIVQVIVPGHVLLQCLENSVSAYPKLEGRYAAVSGLNFVWDPERPAYKRVISV
jgi:5'-nucleotidase